MAKKILVVIVILFVVLFLVKDFIISALITNGITAFTNLSASIQSIKVGVFKNVVDIKGFKIYNPRSFEERVMVEIPEFYVEYDLGSFLTGTKHIKTLRLNLSEFNVVKNDAGALNLDSLKAIQTSAGGGGAAANQADIKFKIDVLELKIGKVSYRDHFRSATPQVKEFNIDLNERYENITNPYTLVSLIVFKALANTTIASLADFDLGPLKNAAYDSISKTAKDALDKTTESVKKLWPLKK